MGFGNNAVRLGVTGSVTADQTNALAGTSGSPSVTNKFVTNADSRNSNTRIPTDASVTSAKMDASLLKYASVSLTANEIKALRATPKSLVSAPGASHWVEVLSLTISLAAGATAFTGAGTLQVKYDTGSGSAILDTAVAAGAITASVNQVTSANSSNQSYAASAVVNKAVVLHNIGGAEYLAGDGTAKVKIAYRVHDLS